jgi:hypothetical protein
VHRDLQLVLSCFAVPFLLLSAAPLCAQANEKPQREARIVGRVLDQQGQLLKDISVHAVLKQTGMLMPTVNSNEAGQFVVENLEPGTYDLFSESDAAGYPYTALPFYRSENPVEVTLGNCGTATVVLVLGPRAGVVSGMVLDRVTGKAIVSPQAPHFIVKKVLHPDDSIEFLGPPKFHWLIPPSNEVTMEVIAEGYKSWVYADPSNPSKPLPFQLESGEEKVLNVELEPDAYHETPRTE